MTDTLSQYSEQITKCRDIFQKKTADYGTAWRILRIPSLIDQIYIKAQRIRSIEEKKVMKVEEPVEMEFIGIINYCVIALIQMELGPDEDMVTDVQQLFSLYSRKIDQAQSLMNAKNHDYGEAWRNMYVSSFTDLILMKLLRMRRIIENNGETLISEGLEANLFDIINYAVFALIKLQENDESTGLD